MSCIWIDVCPLREFERQGRLDLKWKREYCEKNYRDCRRYQMEKAGKSHPDNMLPDGSIDESLRWN